MKTTVFTAILITFSMSLSIKTNAQSCGLDVYKEGQTVTFDIRTWINPMLFDPAFIKLKEKKKQEKLRQYSEDVKSGKLKPNVTHFSYRIDSANFSEKSQRIMLKAKVGEQEFTSMALCQNDTMYMTRNVGPVTTEVDGKILGISIQGVQKIPVKIKVGDFLEPYDDYMLGMPVTSNYTMKHKEFAGMETVHYVERNTHHFVDGKLAYGDWNVTQTQAVYNTIDVAVRQTTTNNIHIINYAMAYVSGEEEVEFNGNTYKAFIIESERWSKNITKTTFEASHQEVIENAKKIQDKFKDKVAKKMLKSGIINEQGFAILAMREWYVPGVGVVKMAAIDKYGATQSETVAASIK
jgi:hypothetical protein